MANKRTREVKKLLIEATKLGVIEWRYRPGMYDSAGTYRTEVGAVHLFMFRSVTSWKVRANFEGQPFVDLLRSPSLKMVIGNRRRTMTKRADERLRRSLLTNLEETLR